MSIRKRIVHAHYYPAHGTGLTHLDLVRNDNSFRRVTHPQTIVKVIQALNVYTRHGARVLLSYDGWSIWDIPRHVARKERE